MKKVGLEFFLYFMGFSLKKISFSFFFWLIFYLFLGAILLNNSFSYLDPDFPWHKKVGEAIVIDQAAPSLNIYNFSFTGNWVDHEWLSDAVLHLFGEKFGYIALSLVFVILIIVVFRLLHLKSKKKWPDLPDWLSASWQLFAVLASLPHFGVRIQEWALLFLLLILFILDKYSQNKKVKILFWLIPIMWFWSMTHGSFLLGFFVMGLFVIFKKITGKISWREGIVFSIFSLASFLVTLIGPYGFKLYSFLYGYRDSYYLSHIQEWLPQHFFPFLYPQLIYLAFAVLAFLFFAYLKWQKKESFDLWDFFLTAVFVFLAFKSRRHFPLLVVVSFPFIMGFFRQVFDFKSERFVIGGIYRRALQFLFLFLMLLIGVEQLVATPFTNKPLANYCGAYPCEARKFLLENREYDFLPLFNFYTWGGYLIHELPGRQIFIDGRLPQVEYQGHSFLEEYNRFYSDNQREIENRLQEHKIGLVLIPFKEKEIKAASWEKFLFNLSDQELKPKNNLRLYLEQSSQWEKIYEDKIAVIYRLISQ